MTDNFWKKTSDRLGMLLLGALFGLVAYLAGVEIKDLDLWLHIAVGKYITTYGYVPQVDFLSATIAGSPWVNHEWLFQVLIYKLYYLWGPTGLINMQIVVVILTTLMLLFLGYTKDKQLTTIFLLFLVFLVYQQRFTIRPDIFSLFFFTIYIFIMSLHIDKKWATFGLVVTQILWSNMHGFFFFGPLFVCIGLISEWIKRHIKLPYQWNEAGRLTDSEYKRLKLIFICVILACFVNPGFIHGAWYPLGVFFSLSGENKIFFSFIQELQKPATLETFFTSRHFMYYKLLIVLSFVTFIFNRRRIDISALFFWLIFLIFSLKAARNTSYFAFAAYLVCITNLMSISYKDLVPLRYTEEKFKHLTMSFAKFLFILWLFNYAQSIAGRAYYDFDKYEPKSEFGGVSQRSYPDKAVDFLVEQNVTGNFFNDFNSGAYLIGRCFPQIKVFIDGRTEVYGGEYFKNYQKIWNRGDPEAFEEAVEKYNLSGALLNSVRQHIPKEILNYLYNHEDWKMVYFDYDAVVFLKDIPQNKRVIDQFKIDFKKWEPPRLDLYKLGSANVKPYQNYFRAYTLESLELDELAMKEIEDALRINPHHADSFELLGRIYAKQEDYESAFLNFRIATVLVPFSRGKRRNLAQAYSDLEKYDDSIDQFKKILVEWPNDIQSTFQLAQVYAKNQQYPEALQTIARANELKKDNVVDLLKIGDIILEQKAYEASREVFEIALLAKKDEAQVHKRLGIVYNHLGNWDKANKHLQKALEANPDEDLTKEINSLISEGPIEN